MQPPVACAAAPCQASAWSLGGRHLDTTDIPATVGEPLAIDQRADLKSFLGLSLKNGLLNIVTLTLYRFWGKTEVRRRIWSTTYVNGEPLEYTGRGVELFIGFLIALAVLGLPFLLVIFSAQLMGPAAALLIILPSYLGMIFLFGFGQFTAFRYMASRTSWRGVRFLLRGSPAQYAMRFLGYAFLNVVSLGWFWPAARRRLAGELWGGLRFGDRKFSFDIAAARKSPIYGAYAMAIFGALGVYLLTGVAIIIVAALLGAAGSVGSVSTLPLAVAVPIYAVFAVGMLGVVAVTGPYQAAVLRSVAAGTSFDGVRFRADITGGVMARLVVTNVLLIVVSLGFLMPLVQARTLKTVICRIRPEGTADLSAVRQAANAGPKTGEGLADAFGISAI